MEETLGKRIAANRKRLSLTQDALAEQLGVTAQAVSKWENDQSCPDITMLPKLSAVFDITTDELLGMARKDIPIAENIPRNSQSGSSETEDVPYSVRKRDAVRLPPYDLADIGLVHIAISCGIFVFGIFSLFRRFSLLRLGCAMAGGIFIFTLVTEPGIADMDWYVPLLAGVALFGLDLLTDQFRNPKGAWKTMPAGHMPEEAVKNDCAYEEKAFHCTTRFGQGDRLIQLPQLVSGSGDVTFGELTIDLSGCGEVLDGCSIDLSCTFGSLEILIPRKFRVEASNQAAFGTVEEKGLHDPDALSTIFLNCKVSFGQITIRHI